MIPVTWLVPASQPGQGRSRHSLSAALRSSPCVATSFRSHAVESLLSHPAQPRRVDPADGNGPLGGAVTLWGAQ